MPEVTGLLLAAGKSSRFGSQKLLHPVQGKTLIEHSIASLSACDQIIAVIRDPDEPLQRLLQSTGIDFVINPQAEQGMGSSIACGIRAIENSDAWCILPADMLFVTKSTTQRIVAELREGVPIAAPFFQGRRGHPVGFGSRFKHQLLALDGDSGARDILRAESNLVTRVDVDDPGVLIDIDTPEDLITQIVFPDYV